MIVSAYLEEHQYLVEEPQTLNFGGEYLYSFTPSGTNLIVNRELNDKYIPNFFDISKSRCNLTLLSAVVGQNGVGKSSLLDSLRGIFIPHVHSMPHNLLTVLIEVDGMVKVLKSNYESIFLKNNDLDNKEQYKKIEKVEVINYQTIYYSPHFDLKFNKDFDEVDAYDISLDQFIKQDLAETESKGANENGWKFSLEEELLFKNSMRQIEFLNSEVFNENEIFQSVFKLPQYKTGILHFRDVTRPKEWNTPNELRPIINLIYEKVEKEESEWHMFRDKNSHLTKVLLQALVNKFFIERFVLKAFMSVVIEQMEKGNDWLGEGKIEDPYAMDRFEKLTAKEVFLFFVENSYIEFRDTRWEIFNHKDIFEFIEALENLFAQEKKPEFITKQSLQVNLDDLKNILDKHREIVTNLIHYFPTTEGLVKKSNYTDGFIAFRPTDRNMSSGENALLNFFSKLYSFIQNNLTEERKSLPTKEHYVILLDEADLGFHPVWKKKYIDAILKTLPYFFQTLKKKPSLQVVVTTHDPLTLSDLPVNNIVLLKKNNGYCQVISTRDNNHLQKTFGANITDLLAHSFFIEDGLIGDFAKSKIREVIDWINKSKTLSEEKKSAPRFKETVVYYKKVISLIDENVIKLKLTEMITDLIPDNEYFNTAIDKEIELLKSKRR